MKMFCPECGRKNPSSARFCMSCGENFNQSNFSSESLPESSLHQNSDRKKTSKPFSTLSVLLFFTTFGIIVFVGIQIFSLQLSATNSDRQDFPSYTNTSSQPDTLPQQPEPQNYRIVNQAFTLDAGQLSSYKFTIPKSSGGATVTGNFVASGGSNDIYVVITNETGFTNLKNRNSYNAYYDSGKVTTDDLNVNLSPGTYCIVFSNAHSLMTPKAVNADISVAY